MGMNGCRDFSKVKLRRRRATRRRTAVGGVRSTRTSPSIQMKVKKLQTLIPGGERLQPDRLFSRTADYIMHLRLQVNVLQALTKFYNTP